MQPKDITERAPKSLAESVERLRVRNAEMRAYLEGKGDDAIARVANSPNVPLEDATERARKYWDKLEARRSSVPAPPPAPKTEQGSR